MLASQTVVVNGTGHNINTNFWQKWVVNSPPEIIVGNVYTFQFIPSITGGLPDPYIIVVNPNNPYAGGRNSQSANFDNPFKTFVKSALPLNLLSFDAGIEGKNVRLRWETASEFNTERFEIERSFNAVIYDSIGRIEASGKLGSIVHYSFSDQVFANRVGYYRLRMVDKDEAFTYSPVCKVNEQDYFKLVIYPNPAKEYIFIDGLRLKAMQLLTVDGKILIHRNLFEEYKIISVGNIPSGYYTIVVYNLFGKAHTGHILVSKRK